MSFKEKLTNLPPFIVFEGIDGSGKSSLCEKIYHYFAKSFDCNIWATKEPFLVQEQNIQKEKIEQDFYEKNSPVVEQCNFFLRNRRMHNKDISKRRCDGSVVFSDRYDLSTYTYQANPLEKNISNLASKDALQETLFGLIYHCHFDDKDSQLGVFLSIKSPSFRADNFFIEYPCIIPDITFFCNVGWEKVKDRLDKRIALSGEKRGYFEQLKKMQLAFERYPLAIDFLIKKDDRLIINLDANQKEQHVFEQAKKEILNHLSFFEKCKKKN